MLSLIMKTINKRGKNQQKENKMRAKKKPKFSFCNIEIHSKSRGMTQNKLIQAYIVV